jgi:hypothetical protein
MNEYLILGRSLFWLVTGWLGAGFAIRRVYRRPEAIGRGSSRPTRR